MTTTAPFLVSSHLLSDSEADKEAISRISLSLARHSQTLSAEQFPVLYLAPYSHFLRRTLAAFVDERGNEMIDWINLTVKPLSPGQEGYVAEAVALQPMWPL